jgi:hypothetical protein
VNGTIEDTVIQGTQNHGLSTNLVTSGTAVNVVFDHSQSVNNGGNGVVSNGAGSNIIMSNSVASGNGNFGVAAGNSGVITSLKNNTIIGNHNDSTASLTPVNPS